MSILLQASPMTVHLAEVSLVRLAGEMHDLLTSGSLSQTAILVVRQAQASLQLAARLMETEFQHAAELVSEEMIGTDEIGEECPW